MKGTDDIIEGYDDYLEELEEEKRSREQMEEE